MNFKRRIVRTLLHYPLICGTLLWLSVMSGNVQAIAVAQYASDLQASIVKALQNKERPESEEVVHEIVGHLKGVLRNSDIDLDSFQLQQLQATLSQAVRGTYAVSQFETGSEPFKLALELMKLQIDRVFLLWKTVPRVSESEYNALQAENKKFSERLKRIFRDAVPVDLFEEIQDPAADRPERKDKIEVHPLMQKFPRGRKTPSPDAAAMIDTAVSQYSQMRRERIEDGASPLMKSTLPIEASNRLWEDIEAEAENRLGIITASANRLQSQNEAAQQLRFQLVSLVMDAFQKEMAIRRETETRLLPASDEDVKQVFHRIGQLSSKVSEYANQIMQQENALWRKKEDARQKKEMEHLHKSLQKRGIYLTQPPTRDCGLRW